MGMILVYFLIFILILIVLAIVSFFDFRKFGHKKTAIIVSSVLMFLALNCIFGNHIDEFFHFKSDVIEDLKLVNLNLKDDFQIINNEVVGFPERYQKTKLKISEQDKNRIISKIKNGKYFVQTDKWRPLYYKMMGKNCEGFFANYQNEKKYFRESYSQKEGYVAISAYTVINIDSNEIEFNKIED